MSLLGDLVSVPFKLLNVPAKVIEKFVDPGDEMDEEDKFLSKPLETIAKELKEAVDGKGSYKK